MPAPTKVGEVDKARVGWAMKLAGLALIFSAKAARVVVSAAGPISTAFLRRSAKMRESSSESEACASMTAVR